MKITVDGKEVEVLQQRIETIVSKFTEVYLEDGSIVRVRLEVRDVFRDANDPEVYFVRCARNFISVDKSQVDVKRFLDS